MKGTGRQERMADTQATAVGDWNLTLLGSPGRHAPNG